MQIVSWSLVAICKGAVRNKARFCTTRILIGILKGGFVADLVLWLSYFYTSKELPIRLVFLDISLTQIFTSLLAFGISRMCGIEGLAGWRWLFILESILTFLIGLRVCHAMAPLAVQKIQT